MRLFIAIALPEEVKDKLLSVQRPVEGVRWLSKQQLHLTLKFVGNPGRKNATKLAEALEQVSFTAFEITLKGLGTFPLRGQPRVLWAGVTHKPELMELQKRVEVVAEKHGADKERRKYTPHVTIARVKSGPARELLELAGKMKGVRFGSVTADRFILYRSLLKKEGAVYEQVADYRLRS